MLFSQQALDDGIKLNLMGLTIDYGINEMKWNDR